MGSSQYINNSKYNWAINFMIRTFRMSVKLGPEENSLERGNEIKGGWLAAKIKNFIHVLIYVFLTSTHIYLQGRALLPNPKHSHTPTPTWIGIVLSLQLSNNTLHWIKSQQLNVLTQPLDAEALKLRGKDYQFPLHI